MCQVIWQKLAGDEELSQMAGNSDRRHVLLLLFGYQILKVTVQEKSIHKIT